MHTFSITAFTSLYRLMSLCESDAGCVPFVQWRELALPVFEGWNGAWGAEGKPPVDPEVLPNASKLAKSAFALAFCVAGGGVGMRFRQTNEQKQKTQWEENNGWDNNRMDLYM